MGLDPRFVAAELKLVEALGKGTAITHHLEPSYFDAMAAAAAQVAGAQAAGRASPPVRQPRAVQLRSRSARRAPT